MKIIDLRREGVNLDELLLSVGDDVVRITSKEGDEFVIEAADTFEREADELGRSAKFMAFLTERSAESGRMSLADIESRLAESESTSLAPGATAETEQDSNSQRTEPAA